MKVSVITFCAFLASATTSSVALSDDKEAGFALSEIAKEIFKLEFSTIEIVTFSTNLTRFDGIVSEIMSYDAGGNKKLFRLKKIKVVPRKKIEIYVESSAIWLFENSKDMIDVVNHGKLGNVSFDSRLVYYTANDPVNGRIVQLVRDQLLLTDIEGDLHLMALRFSSNIGLVPCTVRAATIINKFSRKSMKWTTNDFFTGRLGNTNFIGCEIVVHMEAANPPLSYYKRIVNENGSTSFEFGGVDPLIYDEIARALNFTVFYNPYVGGQSRVPSYFYPQKTVDIGSFDIVNRIINLTEIDFTYPYKFDYHSIFVPPGESYSSFDKMFLPFDTPTWMLIGITFAAAFVIILCLEFTPSLVKGAVFGSQVTTPWYNVAGAFFGIGQVTLPRRSFARFLLMAFILYSLIIRTAYQGKSFEILQKDVLKKPIQSLEEAFDKNYTIYVPHNSIFEWKDNAFYREWKDNPISKRMKIYPDPLLLEFFLGIASNATSRTVGFIDRSIMTTFSNAVEGKVALNILDEKFNIVMQAFEFRKSAHVLYRPFNRKLKQLIEGGIVHMWIEQFYEKKFDDLEDSGPTVLTLEHLEVGFLIWLVCLLLTILVFLVELIIFHREKISKILQSLHRLIIFKSVIQSLGKTSYVSH